MAADYRIEKFSLKLLHPNSKNHKSIQRCLASRSTQQNTGFTLLEVLVVVVMIGILSAIVAPSWLGFANRQRINKANDAILSALQDTQREAKKTKNSYSFSFKMAGNIPKIAVHLDSIAATSLSESRWKPLGSDLEFKSGQVVVLTNITSKNTAGSSVNLDPTSLTSPQTITFDHMGALPKSNFGTVPVDSKEEPPGLKIVVALPNPGGAVSSSSLKRCIIVKTLLGSMVTAKDSNCN